jgi:hypothetical protein
MSLHQNEHFNESVVEAKQERMNNPLSFNETVKTIGRINMALYGINPYSELTNPFRAGQDPDDDEDSDTPSPNLPEEPRADGLVESDVEESHEAR